jgi:hypothetical protein
MLKNHKAQITVFIILGIALLAVATFLYYIVSEVTVTNLQSEQESSVAGIFQKEGLRLFVADCLKDSLEEGLVKIGEGGRLWYDNSELSGTISFSENYNGINYNNQYYYLALTNDLSFEYQAAYPCEQDLIQNPIFCQYLDQDPADFGHKEGLTATSIESDLEKFVKNSTLDCVQEFLSSELSYSGDLGEGELSLNLEIKTDGINIEAEYPLELTVEDETFFHLTTFDYFYPSDFKTFLQHAVTNPLASEQRDVNFNWTKTELLDGSRKYTSLSPSLKKEEVGESTMDLGHNVITYKLDPGRVLETDPYSFSFAIQNRPPALDYIQREACSDYDILVIPDSNQGFEAINITATAYDPDQDEIKFTYYPNISISSLYAFDWQQINFQEYFSNISANIPESFDNFGFHNIVINATDTHGLSDWQDVRVLIDRPLTIDVSVENAYARNSPYFEFDSSDPIISVEDPFFVRVTTPDPSSSSEVSQSINIKYTGDNTDIDNFEYALPAGMEDSCYSFPWTNTHTACSIEDYSDEELEQWIQLIHSPLDYSYMSYPSITDQNNPPPETSVTGFFKVEVNANYCSNFNQDAFADQAIKVVQCIPNNNPTHPFAFPYHENYVDEAGNYLGTEEINPFNSTHSCCNTDNTFLPSGTECYQSPVGCYGSTEYTKGKAGYIQEQYIDVCSGLRGNVCGTLGEDGKSTTKTSSLVDYSLGGFNVPALICGRDSEPDPNDLDDAKDIQCSNIPDACEGELAWTTVTDNQGNKQWCHGTLGCEQACTYTSESGQFPIYTGDNLNEFIVSMQESNLERIAFKQVGDKIYQEDHDFDLTCSSCKNHVGQICDKNYNGKFEGLCKEIQNTGALTWVCT